MNRYFPRLIGVDLSSTTRNLMYEDIIANEAIYEDLFEHETTTCEAQPHIISRCNEKDQNDDEDINGEKLAQYEEEDQPSEPKMEVRWP